MVEREVVFRQEDRKTCKLSELESFRDEFSI